MKRFILAAAIPNAEVEYVDSSRAVVATDRFYDPGLDENSPLAKEQKERGQWRWPHLAYGCGRKLILAAALCGSLAACSTAPTTTVSNSVAAAQIALTNAERVALLYTSLPRCPVNPPPCSDPATVQRIKDYDNKAYDLVKAARNNEALIGVAMAAIETFSSVIPR
jgi:hypothetical protein